MGIQKITPPQKLLIPPRNWGLLKIYQGTLVVYIYRILDSHHVFSSPPEALVSSPAKKAFVFMIPVVPYGYGIGYRPPNLGIWLYSQWMILVCHIHHERKPEHDNNSQGLLYMKEWDAFVQSKNAVASDVSVWRLFLERRFFGKRLVPLDLKVRPFPIGHRIHVGGNWCTMYLPLFGWFFMVHVDK